MKKSFYFMCAAALGFAMNASAQSTITATDADPTTGVVTLSVPWDDGENPYNFGGDGVMISGVTVQMANEFINYSGLPFINGLPVTLAGDAVVKMSDSPETDIPDFNALLEDEEIDPYGTFTLDAVSDENGELLTAIPYHWIIEGTGNEIYLDSHCTMGGTFSGDGDVTIYVSKDSKLTFDYTFSPTLYADYYVLPDFTGTIYLKPMPGYEADTISILGGQTDHDRSGSARLYALDITAFDGNVVLVSQTHHNWPMIIGKGVVQVSGAAGISPSIDWGRKAEYDVTWEGGGSQYTSYHRSNGGSAEAARVVFNGPVNTYGGYFYFRSDAQVIVNADPCFSNYGNAISTREGGILAGNGYLDNYYDNNAHRALLVTAGQGWNDIGKLTIKNYTDKGGTGRGFGFDFNGHDCDQIVFTGDGYLSDNTQYIYLNLMDEFFNSKPETGKYRVLVNANENAAPVNDTIGYFAYDANMTFIRWDKSTGAPYHVLDENGEPKYVPDSLGELQPVWDTITFASTLAKYFPDVNTNGDITKSGYDGGNNRYRHVLAYWGPGEGTSMADYVSIKPQNHSSLEAGSILTNALDSINNLTFANGLVPGTNDSVCFSGHDISNTISGTDVNRIQPLLYTYDRRYNYTLTVRNNSYEKVWAEGDTLNLRGDALGFTFRTPIDTLYAPDGTQIINYEYRYTTEPIRLVYDGQPMLYWFDFSELFTEGFITLCSEEAPTPTNIVKDGQVSDAYTHLKEIHAVKSRSIYTLDGKSLKAFQPGFNIVTTQYTDGTIENRKVFLAQ